MKQLLALITLILLTSCGIQSIPTQKNQVEADFAEIMNQYKRRTDLIPNLVQTVKGYAKHERETLQAVITARASATQVKIDASNLNPKSIQALQKAQSGLSGALSKLMMVSERYPDLKANQSFQALQAQLEGTENRITIARRRYIESVKKFNNLVTVFPTSYTNQLMFHEVKLPQFTIEASEKVLPKVKF
jgi:LemA protein